MLWLSRLKLRAARSLSISTSFPTLLLNKSSLSWTPFRPSPSLTLSSPPSATPWGNRSWAAVGMHTRLRPQLGSSSHSSTSPRPTCSAFLRHTAPLQPWLCTRPPPALGLHLPRHASTIGAEVRPLQAAATSIAVASPTAADSADPSPPKAKRKARATTTTSGTTTTSSGTTTTRKRTTKSGASITASTSILGNNNSSDSTYPSISSGNTHPSTSSGSRGISTNSTTPASNSSSGSTGTSNSRSSSSSSSMDRNEPPMSDVRRRVLGYKAALAAGEGPMAVPQAPTTTRASKGSSSAVSRPGAFKPVPLDGQEYWQQVLDKVKKSNVEDMKDLMDVKHPIGMTQELIKRKGGQVMCYDLFLQWKQAFPKNIVLMQLGDFYETIGLDALVMIQWLGYRPSAEKKGIPKAGAPKNQLGKVVADLNSYGFTVTIVAEVTPSQFSAAARTRSKDRVLVGVSSPARPMYIPPAGSGEGDNSNQLFAQQRPIIGIGWSKSGFITHVLSPELRTIEIWEGMSWEAVVALLGAKGAAALLLHTSLEDMHKKACRLALARMGREEVANYMTFGGGSDGTADMTDLFVAEVKAQLYQHFEDQDMQAPFKLVHNLDREEGRPQPLPRSTVMQLGLEGDMGIRSLLATALPDGGVLCQEWMRQLLLLPPPPHMASHIQGMVAHLRSTDEVLSHLNTELPGSKVTEVLMSLKGDAPFFRELHGMLVAVIDMLRNEGHAELWRHALSYTTWLDKRPTEGLTAAELLKRLQQAVDIIEDVVELQPRSAASMAASGSSDDTDQDSDGSPGAGAIPKTRKKLDIEEEMQSFWDSHEQFRFSVRGHRMEESIQQVEEARDAFERSVMRFADVLSQRSSTTKVNNKPTIRNLEDNHLVVQVPPLALLKRDHIEEIAKTVIRSEATTLSEIRGGTNAWVTRDITEKRIQYECACDVAQGEADAHLRQLCGDLVHQLPELLLACRCSVVISALQRHTQAAMKASWTIPHLAPTDGTRSDPSGTMSQQPSMRMSLEGYWPYWMSRDGCTVLNNVTLDRLMLLTGPNMAGKSTVLRSLCAVAVLANCGLMVPALCAHVPFYDAYLLRNFSGDSPVENMSSFAMEMQEVSIADQQCTSRSLVLLDEMCKGTEVAKGTALAAAVIIDWCRRGFTGVFATHLHALVGITEDQGLERNGALAYKRMGLTDGDGTGHNRKGTWKLEDGHCFESLAFEVAQSQGMRGDLIASAGRIYDAILSGAYPMSGVRLAAGQAAGISQETGEGSPAPTDTTLDTSTATRTTLDMSPAPARTTLDTYPVPPRSTLDTYTAPARTLDEAMDVMRAVVGQRFDGGGEQVSAEGQPMFKVIKPGQAPPPSHADRAAVYVVQWANGAFYSGETGCVSKRAKEHRGTPGKGPTTRHRGPETSMAYCLMPDGEAHAARELEPKLISALKDKAFPLTSSKDQKKTRIARNSSVSKVDKV